MKITDRGVRAKSLFLGVSMLAIEGERSACPELGGEKSGLSSSDCSIRGENCARFCEVFMRFDNASVSVAMKSYPLNLVQLGRHDVLTLPPVVRVRIVKLWKS